MPQRRKTTIVLPKIAVSTVGVTSQGMVRSAASTVDDGMVAKEVSKIRIILGF